MAAALAVALVANACADEPAPDSAIAALAPASPSTHKAAVKKRALTVTGTAAGSRLALRSLSSTTLAVDVDDDGSAEFTFDRSTFETIRVDAGDGDDFVRMDESGGAFTIEEKVTILGGRGHDTLLGGVGAEVIFGGAGNDFADGGQGADSVFLGEGEDTFNWDPGDGSDAVEGEAGADALVFNGANIGEEIDLSANGARLRLTRNIATITMDVRGVERVDFNARGGADRVVVNDLAGTDVADVNVELESFAGSDTGDGQPDVVVVQGTSGADIIDVQADGAAVVAQGVGADVSVTGGEVALDALFVNGAGGDVVNVNGSAGADEMQVFEANGHALVTVAGFTVMVDALAMSALVVNGLEGDDTIRGALGSNPLPVELDGGEGRDTLLGGNFPEVLRGGPGDDVVDGGPGVDSAFLGAGDDTFTWDPGDGSDVIEGEIGADVLLFNGSGANEDITIGGNGGRGRLFRNVAAVTLDLGGVERFEVNTRGGADRVFVEDLAGTEVAQVEVDLAAFPGTGTGDTQPDAVVIQGTTGADTIDVAADGAAVVATGLAAVVSVTGGEPALDALTVNGAGGDVVNVNGSSGADTLQVFEASGHGQVSAAQFNVLVDAFAMGKLAVNGLGGDDTVAFLGGGTTALPLVLDGGEGSDQVRGGFLAEVLIGGPGPDVVDGGPGSDDVRLGDGDDIFVWDPGDGSDVVEGESGTDVLLFNGSNIGEDIDLSANGGRLRVFRNVANVTLDLDGVEQVDLNARGGIDRLVVNDLASTVVAQVNLDLAALPGTAQTDAASDLVIVCGTPDPDAIALGVYAGPPSVPFVSGLAVETRILHPDPFDQLTVNGLGGVDSFSADPAVYGLIFVTLNQD